LIGIDLGKTVFHLVGVNLRGEVVVRKKFSHKQLLHFTANLQAELIGMEACGGAHFLGRALREQGQTALSPGDKLGLCETVAPIGKGGTGALRRAPACQEKRRLRFSRSKQQQPHEVDSSLFRRAQTRS
jgi:hypothetical protein